MEQEISYSTRIGAGNYKTTENRWGEKIQIATGIQREGIATVLHDTT